MAKTGGQKLKLLYLTKLFYEKTDESHGLTIPDIISYLNKYDISADRKTLYQDFEELRRFGLDLTDRKEGRNTYYQLVSRDFELAELKLLVDSVLSSKFITEKKSRLLIKKLESLVSKYDAKQLHRQVLISGRIKTMNESIYYNVDKIHTAINSNKQIHFKYFQWNIKKEEVLRHDGSWYNVSPWHLRWDDENYYLIAYDSSSDSIKHYRVDKMKSILVTDTDREGQQLLKNFDAAKYTKQLFGMYGGTDTKVVLQGENSAVGVLIDRFGKDIPIVPIDGEHFEARVDVTVSHQFFGWIIGLGGVIKIVSPDEVVKKMGNLIEKISEQYPKL